MRAGRVLTSAFLCATALGAAFGCSSHGSGWELGQARLAVVGGEPTGGQQPSVVRVFGVPPPGAETPRSCTGTMLAPNLVALALHCVSPITGDYEFGCSIDGELTDPPKGTLGAPFPAEHVGIAVGPDFTRVPDARGVQLLHTRSTQICQNDLAFLILDTPLDVPISPVRIDSRVQLSELVTVVGYGLTGDPPLPPDEVTMRRQRTGLRVLAVEQEGREKARPHTFTLGESVCMGDSGGPALSEQGAVLGVYSTNVAGCSTTSARNFFTMLSPFRNLVLEAYEAAGATPWLEGEPEPGTTDAGASLDAGPLQPHDSTPGDVTPGRSGGRVDSGFCATGLTASGLPGSSAALAALLLGLAARRRRPSAAG